MASPLIQAVIFDLDGTAVESSRAAVAGPDIIAAIDTVKSHLHLSAATGRTWHLCRDIFAALKLTDPCIISGGAVIVDPVTQAILWKATIEPASAAAVAKVMAHYGYPAAYARGIEENLDIRTFTPDGVNAMYLLDVPQTEAADALEQFASIPGITVSKAVSWSSEAYIDLNVTNANATKEHAIYELSRLMGIPTQNMAGVGDGYNDIHLFNAVGHKVAMANAVPDLKAAADEVIGSVDENGLGAYILTLIK